MSMKREDVLLTREDMEQLAGYALGQTEFDWYYMEAYNLVALAQLRKVVKWLEERNQPNRTLTGSQLYVGAISWEALKKLAREGEENDKQG